MLQPVILDKNGTHRFKENAIVNMLITGTSQSDSYLNNICFYLHDNHTQQTIDEQRHLYQLIGYSVMDTAIYKLFVKMAHMIPTLGNTF
jgi:ornithine cyclodeaminase/alanine dehydrogenase-like protein (mu-crystallin family)